MSSPNESETFFQQAFRLESEGRSFVVATLSATRGHAPQNVGAKAIITSEGLHFGTVGGGKIEAKVISVARDLLRSPRAEENIPHFKWNLQRDIGMSCGGEVEFFFEVFTRPTFRIVIFGAGHVGQALARTLLPLKCEVLSVDSRPEWLEKLPLARNLTAHLVPDLASGESFSVETAKLFSEGDYFVVMTKGHGTDFPILQNLFTLFPNAPYIGCMGSTVKALKLKKELRDFGVSADKIDRFHSPIGESFGSNDPFEIAISVTAELLKARG
jgi:xanthine dehydrogenase accessory factor